jgi:hypothetical protein
MSWLFSRALVEEYSAANCSDGELSAQLSSSPTPQAFLPSDKTTGFWSLSRFGMTCAPSTESLGPALLTWFRGAFLAKTSARQVRAPAWRANAAASGLSSNASWATFDPATSSLKTAQHSFLEDSTGSSVILPNSGLMLDGRCYPQKIAVPRMKGSAPGSLPTPVKSWGRRGPGLSNNLENLRCNLGTTLECLAIREGRWVEMASQFRRLDDGLAHAVERTQAAGNGQVPIVAATAWRILTDPA